ncbi:MAG: ATP-binding protein [Armatimonadetes bacterium]|nr:ATP-binding protein [Armatimonadota bacterium]
MMNPDLLVIEAIKQALDSDPRNGPLWMHYGDLLAQADRNEEAISAYRTTLELGHDELSALKRLVPLLRASGQLAEALIRVERLLEDRDDADLRLEFARVLHARGDIAGAARAYLQARGSNPELVDSELESLRSGDEASEPAEGVDRPDEVQQARGEIYEPAEEDDDLARASIQSESMEVEDLLSQIEWDRRVVTFRDVAGLEDVKNQIRLRIIAPFKNPEIYHAFRRSAGGGILLYGPPGCGKTFLARATAGECGAMFLSVGIHEILDKYWGESERLLHGLFDRARQRTPAVIFFDEFDALGSSRGRSESQFWKTLVNQLLQEMDGMGGDNEDLMVFAATNAPWSVDSAFRRPGRFDRVFFVPPPDEESRAEILRRHLSKLPGGDSLHAPRLGKQTALMTGADLVALCERASERALARSLEAGKVHPVSMEDFERELKQMTSSASEWLVSARNYARYSNESGQYDELVEYLKKIKRW